MEVEILGSIGFFSKKVSYLISNLKTFFVLEKVPGCFLFHYLGMWEQTLPAFQFFLLERDVPHTPYNQGWLILNTHGVGPTGFETRRWSRSALAKTSKFPGAQREDDKALNVMAMDRLW
jgi:hypothetical protein